MTDNAWKPPFRLVPNRLSEEQVAAFMDELTMLTRKYQVMLMGGIAPPSFGMHPTDHKEVNSGRYTLDTEAEYYFTDGEKQILQSGAVGIVWESGAELDNLVDF